MYDQEADSNREATFKLARDTKNPTAFEKERHLGTYRTTQSMAFAPPPEVHFVAEHQALAKCSCPMVGNRETRKGLPNALSVHTLCKRVLQHTCLGSCMKWSRSHCIFVHCSSTSQNMPESPLSKTRFTGELQLLRHTGVLQWPPQASYHCLLETLVQTHVFLQLWSCSCVLAAVFLQLSKLWQSYKAQFLRGDPDSKVLPMHKCCYWACQL